MKSMILAGLFEGASPLVYTVVIIALICAGIVIGAELFASIAHFIVLIRYYSGNRKKLESGLTGAETARAFLDANNMADVKIMKAGFWRGLIYGNHYNASKKTIYLRGNIAEKSTATAAGIALQKAAIALAYRDGDKGTKFRTKVQYLVPFLPYLVVPIIIVGVIIDAVLFSFANNYMATLITIIVAVAFFVFSVVLSGIILKVEVRANKKALSIIENSNFLSESEYQTVKKIFSSYAISYIADFILAILKLIEVIIKLLARGIKKDK